MGWLFLLAVLLVLVVILTAWLKPKGSGSNEYPYTKTPALFTPAERSFLGVLDQAVGEEYRVFGKVRVADVVSVRALSDRGAWQRAFNKISAKHFDFVLCTKEDLSVIAVVELDDKSHQRRKRQERDRFLSEMCEAVSLPLIQVPAKHAYTVTELRSQVDSVLQPSGVPGPVPASNGDEPSQHVETNFAEAEQRAVLARPEPDADHKQPSCPKCSAAMLLRETKAGANAGQPFWGCSAFPKCRGIIKAST